MKALIAGVIVVASLMAVQQAAGGITPIPGGESQALGQGPTLSYGASVTYAPAGADGLTASFGTGPTPPGTAILKATILVDDGVADSPFHGDYVARAINTIQFDVVSSGYQPDAAMLVLKAASTRTWKYSFRPQIAATVSVSQRILVPLTAGGWTTTANVANKDAAFASDIQAVTAVSIVLAPTYAGLTYYPAQSYTVSGCVVVNDDGISSDPAHLTPLERALIARFGYGYGAVGLLTDAMKKWDTDGDGMFDFVEIWAENDEGYADSIFAAEDIQVVSGGVEVTWTAVKGHKYTVLRSTDVGGTFAPISALSGLDCSETGYMTGMDAATDGSSGPYYYRIRKD